MKTIPWLWHWSVWRSGPRMRTIWTIGYLAANTGPFSALAKR